MLRVQRSPILAALALALALGLQALTAMRILAGAPAAEAAPSGFATLLALVVLAATGRLLLSLLPSGPTGAHGPAHLPATWAASHLLGTLALGLQGGLLEPFGLATSVWALLPWIVLAALRLLLLPGSLVPGPGWAGGARGPLALALLVGIALWSLVLLQHGRGWESANTRLLAAVRIPGAPGLDGAGGTRVLLATSLLAGWVLLADALAAARRPQGVAWAAAAFLALHAARGVEAGLETAFLTAGLSASLAWLRRADRRSLALASAAFAGGAVVGAPWEALAGGAALLWTGTRGQRADGWRAVATAGVLTLSGWGFVGPGAPGAGASTPDPVAALPWALACAAAIAVAVVGWRSGRRTPERRFLLLWIASVATLRSPWAPSIARGELPETLLPAALLLVVLELFPEP